MTLAVMAERLGVTTSAIAAYENGSRKPSFEMLIKIARLFNLSVDSLLGYSNKDLMDVSGLTASQRETIQNMVATFQMFNELVVGMIRIDDNEFTPIDVRILCGNLYDKFKKEINDIQHNNVK